LYSGRKFGISCRARARTISPGCGQRRHVKSARFDCLELIQAQATARRAGIPFPGCIATGDRGYQDPCRMAVFYSLNFRFAVLFAEPSIATHMLMLCDRWGFG